MPISITPHKSCRTHVTQGDKRELQLKLSWIEGVDRMNHAKVLGHDDLNHLYKDY